MSAGARAGPRRKALGPLVMTSAARVLAERPAFAITGVLYVLVTSVLAALWTAAAGANDGLIAGYTAAALVWYVATTEMMTISLPPRMIEYTGDDIGSGRVVVELLRPVPVLAVRVAGEVGAVMPRLALCVALGIPFATMLGGRPPSAAGLALAVPSMVLAVMVNIVAQHAFAGAAFWLRDAKGTWFVYQKLVFVIGGMLLPLEVLPDRLAAVAKALPFMAMAYAPGRLASGHVEPHLLLVQLGWLVVLWLVASQVYAAGEHRLMTVGS